MGETGITIEASTSADGKRRWELLKRTDGFFAYVEETFHTEDEREFGGGVYDYWSPSFLSGLFNSAQDARREALSQFAWLRDANPST